MKNHWLQQRTTRLEQQAAIAAREEKEREEKKRAEQLKKMSSLGQVIVPNEVFEAAISEYWAKPKSPFAQSNLNHMFETLAGNVVKSFKSRLCGYESRKFDEDDAIQECVLAAWQKLHRFADQKCVGGKAFNFFTTIMLSVLRCVWQTKRRNWDDLKKKYKSHLDKKAAAGTI